MPWVCPGQGHRRPLQDRADYLKVRRRIRRRARSRVLRSVLTATRNFDLQLAITTPPNVPYLYVEAGMIPVVYGGNRVGLSVVLATRKRKGRR